MEIKIFWWDDSSGSRFLVDVPNELSGFVVPKIPHWGWRVIAFFSSEQAYQAAIEDRKTLASVAVANVIAGLSDYLWDVTQEAGTFSFADLERMIEDENGQLCLELLERACEERNISLADVTFETKTHPPPQCD